MPVARPQGLIFDAPSDAQLAGPANTSQLAQLAKTPGNGLLGHYPSPIEGVPERLSGRLNKDPVSSMGVHVPHHQQQQPTPPGYSPLEGLPELRAMYRPPSRLGSNQQQQQSYQAQGVDSPREGIPEQMHDIFRPAPSRLGPAHARPPAPASAAAVQGDDSPVEGLVHQAAAPGGGPRLLSAVPSPPAAFAFPSPLPPRRTEMAVQTGASIQGSAEKDHLAAAGPGGFDDYGDDDFGGGGDDGGYDGWDDDFGGDAEPGALMPSPAGPSSGLMPPPPPRPPRRVIKNPGINLRKQLPRKSLSTNPNVGLQQGESGMRRSMRQKNEPLKWWLNESKIFTRLEHKTMPTVQQMTHTVPNTPWQTISDPNEWKGRRNAGFVKSFKHKRAAASGDAGAETSAAAAARGTKKGAAAKKSAPAAAKGGAGKGRGRKRKADVPLPVAADDEIELRNGPEMPPTDVSSDDEETELLPRSAHKGPRGGDATPEDGGEGESAPREEEEVGEEEGQGPSPSPVRAIDLTSPVDLISPAGGSGRKGRKKKRKESDVAVVEEDNDNDENMVVDMNLEESEEEREGGGEIAAAGVMVTEAEVEIPDAFNEALEIELEPTLNEGGDEEEEGNADDGEGTSSGVRMARTARVGAKKKKGKGKKSKTRR